MHPTESPTLFSGGGLVPGCLPHSVSDVIMVQLNVADGSAVGVRSCIKYLHELECTLFYQGCHGQEKVKEKKNFKVRKSQGIQKRSGKILEVCKSQ